MRRGPRVRGCAVAASPARTARPRAPRRRARAPEPTRCCGPRPLQAEQLRDHHALHLVRAFPDLEDLLVTVQARDRVLLHEAVAAVDLERRVRRAVREQAGVELRLRGGEAEVLPLVLEPGGAVDELPPGLDL